MNAGQVESAGPLNIHFFQKCCNSQLFGSRSPFAAAARIREANFAFMADVRSDSGKVIAASSSADLISLISSG